MALFGVPSRTPVMENESWPGVLRNAGALKSLFVSKLASQPKAHSNSEASVYGCATCQQILYPAQPLNTQHSIPYMSSTVMEERTKLAVFAYIKTSKASDW